MASLPPQFSLKMVGGNQKYLGAYVDSVGNSRIVYDYPLLNELTKFEIEPAKGGEGLVHIRSRAHNKYWVRERADSYFIGVYAAEPVEDTSLWNCTLFRPNFIEVDGSQALELVHVQLGWTLHLRLQSALVAAERSSNTDTLVRSRVVDWETVVVLPSNVVFVGDNQKYLKVLKDLAPPFLQFEETDMGSQNAAMVIEHDNDAKIRIRNVTPTSGLYWQESDDGWITCDSSRPAVPFEAIMVDNEDGTFIALRGEGKNMFLARDSAGTKTNYLRACAPSITEAAKFRLVEPVLKRSVREIKYNLDKSRIYGETALVLATQTGRNQTNTPQSMTLSFTYTDTVSRFWSNTVNVHAGVKATFRAGIPLIKEFKVTVGFEVNFEHKWEETSTETKEIQTGYTTTVPPRTKSTIKLVALKGSCDVPFTYTQVDRLSNGETVEIRLSDGVFTGVNAFDFQFETEEEILPEELWV